MLRIMAGVAAAAVVSACSVADISLPPDYGFVTVSAAGEQLHPNASDVPTTLDLRIHAGVAFRKQDVVATLDGTQLALAPNGGDLLATVPPLPLASAHHLAVAVAGRSGLGIDFTVISPTAAMLAAHLDPNAGLVVDATFAGAPDPAALEAAAPGATFIWNDPTHARISWTGNPPGALDVPPTVPTARGAHLIAGMHLDLGGIGPGAVRRITVPLAPSIGSVHLDAFVVDTAASNTSLAAHLTVISAVSPTGWVAQSDGTILGTPDPVAVARAGAAGIPVWPSLANDANDPAATTALLHSPAASSQLIQTTAQAAASSGYAGVNLDFEGMAASDKAAFTAFVQALASALHAQRVELQVDLVPHDSAGVNRYSVAYDVPAIGAAADMVDIMAYDEHANGTVPGPVAGVDWDMGQLAATLPGLNPAHTLLGIPLYARGWQSGSGAAGSYREAVSGALAAPGALVGYDFGAQTPYIKSPDGAQVTYFDDADSLARKIGLAKSQGLAGVAAWRLGFEDPAFWALLG